MIQARHNEMIKLALVERDKILGEIEQAREKLKQEGEMLKCENEAELKRIEDARYAALGKMKHKPNLILRADFELEKAKVKGLQDQKQIRLDVGGVYL